MSQDERERLKLAISDALSERCSCSFSQSYIADEQFLCSNGSSTDIVVFRGRLINTQDTDSMELLLHLQEWLLTDPTVALGGVSLQAAENCQVYHGSITNSTPCEYSPIKYGKDRQSIIGVSASAGILALVAVSTLFVMVVVYFCIRYKIQRHFT